MAFPDDDFASGIITGGGPGSQHLEIGLPGAANASRILFYTGFNDAATPASIGIDTTSLPHVFSMVAGSDTPGGESVVVSSPAGLATVQSNSANFSENSSLYLQQGDHAIVQLTSAAGFNQMDMKPTETDFYQSLYVSLGGVRANGQFRYSGGGEGLRFDQDGSFIAFYDLTPARHGYIQGTASNLLLNAESGVLRLTAGAYIGAEKLLLCTQGVGQEAIRLYYAEQFISFYNSAGGRNGYIQNNATNILINAETARVVLRCADAVEIQGGNLILASGRQLQGTGNTSGGTTGGQGAILRTDSGSNSFHTNWDGATLRFYVDSSNVKNFTIDNPIDPVDKWLVHACAEGPTADVFYRGESVLDANGRCLVTLPTYFERLTYPEGRTVQLTTIDSLTPITSSRIVDGVFTVRGTPGVAFYWRVDAIREYIEVEPNKSDYHFAGVGPYTWKV